ncbi:MAG: hypothetical protein WAK17_09070 [Candidatus Nitrosopolaris sp.]
MKKEFQWLLGEDFSKLLEGFEPVDNRAFMKKDADEQAAGKVTNSHFHSDRYLYSGEYLVIRLQYRKRSYRMG